ncbi:degV family protein [Firmicutes bacterium CAG:534]|nr:degV family protein [Firmicutes bacterium CAG:534]
MSVKIIVDSTTDLLPSIREQVTVVPLTVCFGQEEFTDGVTITHEQFYEKLVECDVLPTTSQASPAAFIRVLSETLAPGDSALILTLSSELSGTYQSAVIAAGEFEEVFVVDSSSVAIGTGILTEYALECVKKGMSAKEIAEEIERKKKDVCVIAMLDTLEYLKKGGRISSTAAFAGGILNIKPVVNIENGRINILGKARGSKQGNNLLIQEIQKAGGIDFKLPILLGYTGLTDVLLQKYIKDSRLLWEDAAESLRYTSIGSVVGTHTGPGVIAAAFFRK